MPGPYPLPTLAAQITPTGVTAPAFADILASLQAIYQGIFGADAYLEPDSQDGQLLSIFATAINDCNNAVIAVYNSFSPATAVGTGLSSNVKLNGLQRQSASNSSVDVTIVGQAGTEIINGLVEDINGNQWALPPSVIIPGEGTVIATATAVDEGAIIAGPGTVTKIVNPTRGWQSVTNVLAATVGAAVETDAALRQRQTISTSLPAQTPLESIVAAVRNLPGVQAVQPYENDTGATNGIGIPGHTIALVVVGGDDLAIATAIADGKLGTGTFGDTTVIVVDANGVPDVIHFQRPIQERLIAAVTVTPLVGYVSTTGDAILAAMSAWVADSVPIGGSVNLNDLVAAAKLPGQLGQTYKIEFGNLTVALFGHPLGDADVPMAWNQEAGLAVSDITLTVL